jgi:hypothetical protein
MYQALEELLSTVGTYVEPPSDKVVEESLGELLQKELLAILTCSMSGPSFWK